MTEKPKSQTSKVESLAFEIGKVMFPKLSRQMLSNYQIFNDLKKAARWHLRKMDAKRKGKR